MEMCGVPERDGKEKPSKTEGLCISRQDVRKKAKREEAKGFKSSAFQIRTSAAKEKKFFAVCAKLNFSIRIAQQLKAQLVAHCRVVF